MKLTKKAGVNLSTLQGRRQWGASGVRPAPHFTFGPRLLHMLHPLLYLKRVSPLVVFGPPCCEILATDSGVLFHTLYATITSSQRKKKRTFIVIHFNPFALIFL